MWRNETSTHVLHLGGCLRARNNRAGDGVALASGIACLCLRTLEKKA